MPPGFEGHTDTVDPLKEDLESSRGLGHNTKLQSRQVAEATDGQGVVESQGAEQAAEGAQENIPAQVRNEEGREEPGEWVGNWLMAGLNQQDLF